MSAEKYTVIVQKVTTEESSFISYGLILVGQNKREYVFNDISTNCTDVERLGRRFIDSDISEIHFRNIVDDFIAMQADALCSLQ